MFDQMAQQAGQAANPFQRKSPASYAAGPKQAALGAAIGGRQMPAPHQAPGGQAIDPSAAGALQQPTVGAPPPGPGRSVPQAAMGPGTLAGMLGGGMQTQGEPASDFAPGGRFASNPNGVMQALQGAITGQRPNRPTSAPNWPPWLWQLFGQGRMGPTATPPMWPAGHPSAENPPVGGQ